MRKADQKDLRDRFLATVQEAYQRYLKHGARSNEKIKVLHSWVIEELRNRLGGDYELYGLSDAETAGEKKVSGKYYSKNVDVAIVRDGITLGVASIKFVMTNYNQNKNNYFEQQLGETANLRSGNIVFGHIMVLPEPIPYKDKSGETKKHEHVDDSVIRRYGQLAEDHDQHHVPNVQCMAVFLLDEESEEILRMCEQGDLEEVSPDAYKILDRKLSIDRFFESMVSEVVAKYAQRRD